MIRIAATADLHVTEGPRLDLISNAWEALTTSMIRGGVRLPTRPEPPDLFVLAGDLYGRSVPHRPTVAEREVLEPGIVRLAEVAPVIIVRGNHDDARSLRRLQDLGGTYPIRVIDVEGLSRVCTPSGDVWLYALPYQAGGWDLDVVWPDEALPRLVVGHLTVAGATTSGGEVLRGDREPTVSRDDLLALDAPVVLGHIHLPDDWPGASVAWTNQYVGSPWPTDYAEDHRHGWVRLDAESPTSCRWEQIDSTHVPVVTMEADWRGDHWDSRFPGDTTIRGSDVRLRLRCPDTMADACDWEEIADEVRLLMPARLTVERIIEPTERARAPQIAEASTVRDKLSAWLDTLDPRPDGETVDAMMEALEEVEE